MRQILSEFSAAARELNTKPVVLFIPDVWRWNEGRKPPPYQDFKETVIKEEFPEILVIDVSDAEFDDAKFNIRSYRGHPSVYGNRVIAAHVADQLRQHGLLD